MAMAPQGQPNRSATNRQWEPLSPAGYFARRMALYLTFLLGALALAIVLEDAVRYLLGRRHRARRVHAGSGSGERDTDNANIADPENPAVEAAPLPPAPDQVYSTASTLLAGKGRYVAFFIVGALQMIAMVLTLLDAIVRQSREGT